MRDKTESPPKTPNYERIARQGYVWLDAKKALIGDPCTEKKKAVAHELRKLAVVLDEERTF